MGLNWTDKVNGVDDILAEDINAVAHALIDTEKQIGNIETALDEIIAIQDSLIGGRIE